MTAVTGSADAQAIAAAKRMLRSAVRLRRDARRPDQRTRDDEQRFERLVDQLAGYPAYRLAAYLSAGTEPDTLRLVAWAAAHGLEVLLPVLTDGAGSWLPAPAWAVYAGPDRLRTGRSQILEPTGATLGPSALADVNALVVPGLAADLVGNRLGRGGGWYDRARAEAPDRPTWLLLNDDEVLEVVPTDAWDLPVHTIITASRTLTVRGS
jgi:5-formyltetrahydrofolate cyclo-ligase